MYLIRASAYNNRGVNELFTVICHGYRISTVTLWGTGWRKKKICCNWDKVLYEVRLGKGKLHPRAGNENPERERESKFVALYLTSTLD
jgi:hypothetical protein